MFGSISGKTPQYPVNVKVYGNKKGLCGVVQTLVRFICLAYKFPRHFNILKSELKCLPWEGSKAFVLWKRHVPVLLHIPDIFHIQWAKGTEEWLYLKQHFGIKIIVSLRGAHINYSPLADVKLAESYRRIFPQIDGFHAVSQAISIEAQKYGADSHKIRVIYSGLPGCLENDKRWTVPAIVTRPTFKLLAVGRFHWKKGYVYLLEALYILKCRGVSVHLTVIASGNMPEEELYLIRDRHLQHMVEHIKGMPFREVQNAMRSHDVLVLPSLEEGIANVVLEAMQIGLPVISTNCGGMGEAISNGKNGLLVPVRNSKAIADAVENLIQISNAQYNDILENARYTIENKFNLSKAASKFAELYKYSINS